MNNNVKEKNSYILQSVDRASSILELLSEYHKAMSAIEIAENLNINRTTVYGLLSTLMNKGYIEKDSEDGKYSITSKIFELGAYYIEKLPVVTQASYYIPNLSNKYNTTVHLSELSIDKKALILFIVSTAMSFKTRIGLKLPLYASSTGKLLLAYLSKEEIINIINNVNFQPYTTKTITNRDDFLKNLEEIKANGYSIENGEYLENIMCISFPIRDATNKVIAALSVSGYKDNIENDSDNIILDGLQVSKNISMQLGWSVKSL